MKHNLSKVSRSAILLLLSFMVPLWSTANVFAFSAEQRTVYDRNALFYDIGCTPTAAEHVTSGNGSAQGLTFPNLDPSQMTDAINNFIKSENPSSKMAGLGGTIVIDGKNSNVSPFLIVAIAHKESSLADPGDYNVRHGSNSFGRKASSGQPSFPGSGPSADVDWYKWSSVKASVNYTAPENTTNKPGDIASYMRATFADSIDSNDLEGFLQTYVYGSKGSGDVSEYQSQVTTWMSKMAGMAGGATASSGGDAGGSSGSSGGGSGGGTTADNLIWPFQTKSHTQYNRVDQGWDIQDKPGANVYAIASGTLDVYQPDPGGFGNDYPVQHLDKALDPSASFPTDWVYYGHVHIIPSLKGKHVDAGQLIAHANQVEDENHSASPTGWLEIGFAQPGTDAPVQKGSETVDTPAGHKMKQLLLNAQPSNGATASSDGLGGSSGGSCCDTSTSSAGGVSSTGNNRKDGFNFFVANGFTPEQSAAIIGNFMQESGMDPTSNDGAGNGGIGGFTYGDTSLPAVIDWIKARGGDPMSLGGDPSKPPGQLDFVLWYFTKAHPEIGNSIKAAKTLRDASYAMLNNYERCLNYDTDPTGYACYENKRIAYGQAVLNDFGGGTGSITGTGAGGCGLSTTPATTGPVKIIKHNVFGTGDGLMGHKPTMIGLHYTAGNDQTVDDVVSALKGNSSCGSKGCIVQFTIDPKGNIYQLTSRLDVLTENIINFNDADIGIEIMGPDENAVLNNDVQFKAVTSLVVYLMQQYHIKMVQDYSNKAGLMGHGECDKWSQGHIGQKFKGIYKNDPAVESTDSHTDPGDNYMRKVRDVVGASLGT